MQRAYRGRDHVEPSHDPTGELVSGLRKKSRINLRVWDDRAFVDKRHIARLSVPRWHRCSSAKSYMALNASDVVTPVVGDD
jgi:hypothetical protein